MLPLIFTELWRVTGNDRVTAEPHVFLEGVALHAVHRDAPAAVADRVQPTPRSPTAGCRSGGPAASTGLALERPAAEEVVVRGEERRPERQLYDQRPPCLGDADLRLKAQRLAPTFRSLSSSYWPRARSPQGSPPRGRLAVVGELLHGHRGHAVDVDGEAEPRVPGPTPPGPLLAPQRRAPRQPASGHHDPDTGGLPRAEGPHVRGPVVCSDSASWIGPDASNSMSPCEYCRRPRGN